MRQPLYGVIADDLTGATDVGSALVKGGLRVIQFAGVPGVSPDELDVDAVIVALKSRSIETAAAIDLSVAAADWLRSLGVRQILFKYCSTFDSTPRGNIGPVAEALMRRMGVASTIFCPSFPDTGRTVYRGHLFVGDQLLSDTGMRNHPLNPMTDSNLVRVLSQQSEQPVGLVNLDIVREGNDKIRAAVMAGGAPLLVVDAATDQDLAEIVEATIDMPLVTGAAGLAKPVAAILAKRGSVDLNGYGASLPEVVGPGAILSGSCSEATLSQIADFETGGGAVRHLDLRQLQAPQRVRSEAVAWAKERLGDRPVLISASASPEQVQDVQRTLGAAEAGRLVEDLLANIARDLVSAGVRRLVVAGGETSGAVTRALGVDALYIGKEIAPGVPWTVTVKRPRLALALKSGNFGGAGFFTKAFEARI